MFDIYKKILELEKTGGNAVLVTVINHSGHSPGKTGAKLLVASTGQLTGTVGGGGLENDAITKSKEILVTKKCTIVHYSFNDNKEIIGEEKLAMLCGGRAELFFEYLGTDANIFIFGAGHIGRAVSIHLKNMNFQTTVIDIRKQETEKITSCKAITADDYNSYITSSQFPENSFFIVATHSHELDFEVLKALYDADVNPQYIGAVASSKKAAVIKERLIQKCKTESDFSFLYMPVGIKIGGNTPEFIAVSIISELISVFFGKIK